MPQDTGIQDKSMRYRVTRDGKTLTECETYTEAFGYLHRYQGQSIEWAMKYEGYKIEEITN